MWFINETNSLQARYTFGLSGESSTTDGLIIPSIWHTSVLSVFGAVAVKAIMFKLLGKIDLNSPILLNSLLKLSPL